MQNTQGQTPGKWELSEGSDGVWSSSLLMLPVYFFFPIGMIQLGHNDFLKGPRVLLEMRRWRLQLGAGGTHRDKPQPPLWHPKPSTFPLDCLRSH